MKEVSVSKELFDRTFKEKNQWQEKYWKLHDEVVDIEREKNKEIERLNNIINEIEGCIEHIISESYFVNEDIDTSKFGYILDKIKTLKGVDKE